MVGLASVCAIALAAGPMGATDESKVPHYFGPWPNWANSPLTTSTATVEITDAGGGPGTGATATATVDPTNGAVTGIDVTNPGHDYVSPQVVIGGIGSGATAHANPTTTSGVVAYTVQSGGSGFTGFSVAITGGGGSGATATASGGVGAVVVDAPVAADPANHVAATNGGYVMPTVEFALPDDPNGTVATGHVDQNDLVSGVVTKVIVDDPGSGYTSAPELVIRNGTVYDPAGAYDPAVAHATLTLSAISPVSVGTGYSSPPTVTVTDPTGAGAAAQATAITDVGAIPSITLDAPGSGYLKLGIKKFQDQLPMFCDPATPVAQGGCDSANPDAKYVPLGVPQPVTYGADHADQYVIGLVQYRTKFNTDLPPTLVRGYVQIETPANAAISAHYPLTNELMDGTKVPVKDANGNQVLGVTPPQWLGPTIAATKDRAVRVVFHNYLPTGDKGDLFLPVDSTMMGSGHGPGAGMNMAMGNGTVLDEVRNPMCTQSPKDAMCFKDNRATLHLHGGTTPWISDGTPHQWITPAGESTPYPQGVSVKNVPDMKDSAGNVLCDAADDGCQTFWYSNQQSARLMFYHDHSWGITRLNVYAGEAAGYMITDDAEKKLVTTGTIPGAADTLPLVVQDRTFVPGDAQLFDTKDAAGNRTSYGQDPTWDKGRWGGAGSFWYHHVYMPAQNPGDASGMSAYGRWMYGPWFWPPATGTMNGPIDNPYFDPNCKVDNPATWQYQTDPFCEPAQIPGTPNISAGMEQFNDTPIVNGTAYPTVTLQPKSYRLRMLNAANDRFFNFQWYVADPTQGDGQTEVKLKQSELDAAQTDPNVSPTPEDASGTTESTTGPDWVQIASEGGFLPQPTVIDGQQPTTWITDPTRFDVGNVDKHSLLLAPAERADAIVDFSKFAGKTLILYNDAPAAFPARVSTYDYYTGGPDLSPTGAPKILPGYGPNTRTIMQVKIAAAAPAPAFDLAKLQAAFRHTLNQTGVFESSQHPIIVGQAAYNTTYGSSFAASGNCSVGTNQRCDGYVRINDTSSFNFNTLRSQGARKSLRLEPKAIHDEMNATTFDEFGRMQANLGIEAQPPTPGAQNVTLYPFVNPPTELIDATKLPNSNLSVTPISDMADGTQIWRVTHNGVDTHPIHFHLFDVQVINRVTWDNIIIPPDANELGWKDTVRISPLEDTIVALRPVTPRTPFEVPNSIRPLSPMTPTGQPDPMFNNVDVQGNPTNPIVNRLVNFGWEYVYHCHILSHEEMDMMRPVLYAVPPLRPDQLTHTVADSGAVTIGWMDNSITETRFVVQRSANAGSTWVDVGSSLSPLDAQNTHGLRSVVLDPAAFPEDPAVDYLYRVVAENTVGYGGQFPSKTVTSMSDPLDAKAPPLPTDLRLDGLGAPRASDGARDVTMSWTASATTATVTYTLQRAADSQFTTGVATVASGLTAPPTTDPNQVPNTTVYYRVRAVAGTGGRFSSWSNVLQVVLPDLTPAAPTDLTAAETGPAAGPPATYGVELNWAQAATPPDTAFGGTFTYQRSTSPTFAAAATVTVTNQAAPPALDAAPHNATAYYRVRADQYGLHSAWSSPAHVAVRDLTPAAPAGLSLGTPVPGPGPLPQFSIDASWTTVAGVTYRVQRSTDATFATGVVNVTIAATSTSPVTDSTVPHGSTVYYRIQAHQYGLDSPWSAPVSATTADLTPSSHTDFAATLGAPTPPNPVYPVSLTWTSQADTTYEVQWSDTADFATAHVVDAANPVPDQPHATSRWYRIRGTSTRYTDPSPLTSAWTTVRANAADLTPVAPTLTAAIDQPSAPPDRTFPVAFTWTPTAGESYVILASTTNDLTTATPVSAPAFQAGTATFNQAHATTMHYWIRVTNPYNLTATSAPSVAITTPNLTPAAPTGLTATPSTSWPPTVTIGWTGVPSPFAAQGPVSYSVTRSDGATIAANVTATSVVDATARKGATFTYTVTVTNRYGLSASDSVVGTTPAAPLVQVTGLTATLSSTTRGLVTLGWTGQPWAAAYEIQWSRSSNFRGTVLAATTTGTTFDVTGLAPESYYFRVRATQPAWNGDPAVVGAWATTGEIRVRRPRAVVVAVQVQPVAVVAERRTTPARSRLRFSLSWQGDPSSVSRYEIRRSELLANNTWTNWATGATNVRPVTGQTVYVDSRAPIVGTRYRYQVRAVNVFGAGPWSNTVSAVAQTSGGRAR